MLFRPKKATLPKHARDSFDPANALSAAEFTQAASLIILNVPHSVVEGHKARKVALSHLAVLFKDKSIARTLLDKNTAIVVVPKNKKMTDLPQFSSLVGKKTFDRLIGIRCVVPVAWKLMGISMPLLRKKTRHRC